MRAGTRKRTHARANEHARVETERRVVVLGSLCLDIRNLQLS